MKHTYNKLTTSCDHFLGGLSKLKSTQLPKMYLFQFFCLHDCLEKHIRTTTYTLLLSTYMQVKFIFYHLKQISNINNLSQLHLKFSIWRFSSSLFCCALRDLMWGSRCTPMSPMFTHSPSNPLWPLRNSGPAFHSMDNRIPSNQSPSPTKSLQSPTTPRRAPRGVNSPPNCPIQSTFPNFSEHHLEPKHRTTSRSCTDSQNQSLNKS